MNKQERWKVQKIKGANSNWYNPVFVMLSKMWERGQGGAQSPPVPASLKNIPSQYTVKKVQVSVSTVSYRYLDIYKVNLHT